MLGERVGAKHRHDARGRLPSLRGHRALAGNAGSEMAGMTPKPETIERAVWLFTRVTCPHCGGVGREPPSTRTAWTGACRRCHGPGEIIEQRVITVDIL